MCYLDDLLLELVESHLEGGALVVEGLGCVPPLVLHGRAPLPLVKQAVDLVDLALQTLQLRVVGLSLLDQLLRVLVQSPKHIKIGLKSLLWSLVFCGH